MCTSNFLSLVSNLILLKGNTVRAKEDETDPMSKPMSKCLHSN